VKWSAAIGLAIGLAAVVALLVFNDVDAIGRTLLMAGWGLLFVVVAHMPLTLCAALGWRELIEDPRPPGLLRLFKLRWIKEAVNALLPVAQVGGEFVRGRLLIAEGVSVRTAAASCTVDVAAGIFSLFAYTLMGLAFFLLAPHDLKVASIAERAIAAGGVIAVAMVLAPRLGLLKLVERLLDKISAGQDWATLGETSGLHDAVVSLYRQPKRLWTSAGWHLVAWMLGTVETFVAMAVLGLHPTLAEAFVIDSLGQGVRAAGFAVPGALGVQEGGYILVCGLFGVGPDQALALSFVRRLREMILGVPGLVVWGRMEGWSLRGLLSRARI
jgi:putative membrane protein